MFGLEMLDVVIGLVFFYLLLSLLASAIQEFIAAIFKLRSKTLVKSIEGLLNQVDDHHADTSTRAFSGTLQKGAENQPYKKDLYSEFIGCHAHYKNVEVASTSTDGSPNLQMANDVGQSTTQDQASTSPKKKQSLASTFFGQAQMPSYLSSKSFADVLTHVLNSDQDIASIEETISKLPPGKTKTNLLIMVKDAQNDIHKFKGNLAHWFDETMDRVSGQYKRKTQTILIVIGIVLSGVFNADTLNIAGKLAQDKNARIQLLQSAITYQQGAAPRQVEPQPLLQLPADTGSLSSLDTSRATPIKLPPPSSQTALDTLVDIHATIQHLINEELESSASSLGLGWDQEETNREAYFSKAYSDHVPQSRTLAAAAPDWAAHRWLQIKLWLMWWAPRIAGWALTAMAVSLGAPFWFDLLNKLINLRSSGQKPPTALEMREKTNQNT